MIGKIDFPLRGTQSQVLGGLVVGTVTAHVWNALDHCVFGGKIYHLVKDALVKAAFDQVLFKGSEAFEKFQVISICCLVFPIAERVATLTIQEGILKRGIRPTEEDPSGGVIQRIFIAASLNTIFHVLRSSSFPIRNTVLFEYAACTNFLSNCVSGFLAITPLGLPGAIAARVAEINWYLLPSTFNHTS